MTRGFACLFVAGFAALGLAMVGPAGAQLTAPPADLVPEPPVASEPHRIESSSPVATSRLLSEDAHRYLQQLGIATAPTTTAPTAPDPAPPPPPPPADAGGISRTIEAETAPAVNASPLFRFRDVTERDGAGSAIVPRAERRAAVEAYRQSLAGKGAAGR
ncbi:hypothetical protein L6Q96_17435 [Candidatus Binatia bacterium]|nr:hypothetical protein [Candidatus Binatia bacterium]